MTDNRGVLWLYDLIAFSEMLANMCTRVIHRYDDVDAEYEMIAQWWNAPRDLHSLFALGLRLSRR